MSETLYKAGGTIRVLHGARVKALIVEDDKAKKKALSDGWHETPQDAVDADPVVAWAHRTPKRGKRARKPSRPFGTSRRASAIRALSAELKEARKEVADIVKQVAPKAPKKKAVPKKKAAAKKAN